ncbi:MAG: hypothetical protein A2Y25_08060 [Candidatus Melainabacteria bacterium GWF2_37_15]|nr:MAG: hypothetical protein A2Y25_08060 [Candidatus Melainabacteria bacterium GWF2_37_15]
MFELNFSETADKQMDELENNPHLKKRLKAVNKALAYLEKNPRHKSLNTHKFTSMSQKLGIEVFEAYAENNTPGAYRIFWCYGPTKRELTILTITPHP